MMKKLIFISLFIFGMFAAHAQYQLKGTVKEAAGGAPVPYATAALLRPDSSAITGVTTSDAGRFVIENIAAGNYLLQVSFLGYEKAYRQVNVPAQSDLGEILLSESVNRLNEVVVEGRRALVEPRLDRIVVNVAGNVITSGLNVQDVLKRLPGLVVDQNGSVRLNGRPATVYIDGRPTRLPAEQVALMLGGMMGDVVDRVELIDNPSSRYEAGMSAAIVDIRLKRDASLGLNGAASLGGGFTDYDFIWQGGLNLNYRSKKFNIFGNYGYNHAIGRAETYQKRNYSGAMPVTYDQNFNMRVLRPTQTLRAGIDWFVTPKQTVGLLFTGTNNQRNEDIAADAAISRTGSAETDSTEISGSRAESEYSSQMYNLNYQLAGGFTGGKGEVLTADLDYGHVYNHSWQDMQRRYFDPDGSERRLQTEFQYGGPRAIDIFSVKADYVKPFSEKSRMEAGAKTGQTVTDNGIRYENLYDGRWEVDYNQTNNFKYTERVSAGYATYSHQFGRFSAMAGLRAEYTSVKGESPTMDTTFTRSYLGWFPSAYVQYKINDKQMLNLSYSRKINRPGYSLLNPFRRYMDPFTYGSGNPDLNPSYLSTIALRYNIGRYMVNASYSAENDVFEKTFIQDDANRITNISQSNIGKRQQLNLTLSVPVQVAKWYALNIYAQGGYYMVDALYDGKPIKTDYLAAMASMQHAFTILPTLRANLQMMAMSPSRQGIIAQMDGIWTMNAHIEKTFLDKRLSLALSCNDIFASMVYYVDLNFANINQYVKENLYQRSTMLTVRYSFGSQKIRGARNRTVGIQDEMGRTQ
jgi:hypothetical protein